MIFLLFVFNFEIFLFLLFAGRGGGGRKIIDGDDAEQRMVIEGGSRVLMFYCCWFGIKHHIQRHVYQPCSDINDFNARH